MNKVLYPLPGATFQCSKNGGWVLVESVFAEAVEVRRWGIQRDPIYEA